VPSPPSAQCGRPVDRTQDFCTSRGYYTAWDRTMVVPPSPPPPPGGHPPGARTTPDALPPRQPRQSPVVRPAQPPPRPIAGPTLVCPACGQVNPASRSFCTRCAARFGQPAAPYPPAEPASRPRRRLSPAVVLAAVLAVGLVIVAVVLGTAGGDGGAPPGGLDATTGAGSPTGTAEPTAATAGSASGATPGTEPTRVDPATLNAEASSELPPDPRLGLSYSVHNTLDGDRSTAWNSNGAAVGTGVGQVLTYRFATKVHLVRIELVNGYVKTNTLFTENGRIRGLAVRTDAGTAELTVRDGKNRQGIDQDLGTTGSVTLTVTSVYPGLRYPDLALTEITFYAVPAG